MTALRARDRLTHHHPVLAAQEKFKRLEAVLKAESEKKEKEDRSRLPDPPKTAQDIWQQSVIGDYLARFKVCNVCRAHGIVKLDHCHCGRRRCML